jgi:hypothetical protein
LTDRRLACYTSGMTNTEKVETHTQDVASAIVAAAIKARDSLADHTRRDDWGTAETMDPETMDRYIAGVRRIGFVKTSDTEVVGIWRGDGSHWAYTAAQILDNVSCDFDLADAGVYWPGDGLVSLLVWAPPAA